MAPKRYREGSPNTVLRSMSNTNSEQSGNSMNVNSSQNTSNSRNNRNLYALARQAGRQMAEEERLAKKPRTIQPQFVTAAQLAQRKQKENFNNLRTKRNSLPRGLFSLFSNTNLQRAVSRGRYQNMNAQLNSKLKLANNHERRIKNQLRTLPNGNFRKNVSNKINNVIGNNTKTNALLKQITNEKNRLNAAAKAKANANARAKATIVNLKQKKKAAAKANANARAKANANARAKAATPVNSVRNSVTNIGNGGNSIENNASSPVIIAANRNGKTKKKAILLEIIKMSRRTVNMAKNNRNGFLKLMPMVNNANSILEYHTYTWALLYDLISTIDGTKFTALQITPKTLKDIHKKLIVKNTYTTGRSTGGMGNRQEQVFNFTDEEVVEFLFLIWLDGNHDAYIRESFKDWLDDKNSNAVYFTNRHRELAKNFVNEFPDPRKYINNVPKFSKTNAKKEREEFITQALRNVKGYETIRKICIETKSVWFFIHNYNGDPERKNTKLQTSVKMGFGTFSSGTPSKTSLANNFETILKMGIEKILDIKQSDYIYTGTWEINKLKQGNMIHEVSLDQESGDKILSKTITNTPKFRPYITTAGLIDPGKHMLDSGAGSTDRLLLLNAMKTKNMNFLDNLQCHYHIGPVKFVIRNGGLNFLKVDLSIRKGGPPIKKEGNMPTLDFFQLKINETNRQSGEIIQGGIKKNATNPSSKMGKFMGDALQYMTVSVQNTYRKKPRFFASGDGSACFMNAYFCHKLNIPLRLIIDTGVGNIRSAGLQNNT